MPAHRTKALTPSLLAWLLLFALPLAGCAGKGPTQPSPAVPLPAAQAAGKLALTGCKGAIVGLDGPMAVYRGTTPHGWQPNSFPNNYMRTQPARCEGLSWGPFTRGPIYVVQDWQANFTAPDKCRAGPPVTDFAVLESIGFSDPEVAAYAREVHGMNAYAANFTFSIDPATPAGGGKTWTWTWTPQGGATSRVTLHDLVLGANATPTFTYRLYWGNGQGVSSMDFSETIEASSVFTGAAEGVLAPPATWGRFGPAQFATPQDNLQDHASYSGAIKRFGDTHCEQPL